MNVKQKIEKIEAARANIKAVTEQKDDLLNELESYIYSQSSTKKRYKAMMECEKSGLLGRAEAGDIPDYFGEEIQEFKTNKELFNIIKQDLKQGFIKKKKAKKLKKKLRSDLVHILANGAIYEWDNPIVRYVTPPKDND